MGTLDCPNCLTPWKCNGPHLEKVHDHYYKSKQGHYTFENGVEWLFLPVEREFTKDELLSVYDTLDVLNKKSLIS